MDSLKWAKEELKQCLINKKTFLRIKNNLLHCCVYDDNVKKMYENNETKIKTLKSFIKEIKNFDNY